MKQSAFLLLMLFCLQHLNAQQYKKLHFSSFLVDTHNDIPSSSIAKKVAFNKNLKGNTHSDINRMFEGGVDAQMFSIFCSCEQKQPIRKLERV